LWLRLVAWTQLRTEHPGVTNRARSSQARFLKVGAPKRQDRVSFGAGEGIRTLDVHLGQEG